MSQKSRLLGEAQVVHAERLSTLWGEFADLPQISKRDQSLQVLLMGWNSIRRSPLTSVLTLISTTAALFLFSLFLLVVANSQHAVSSMSEKATVSIYIKEGVDGEAAAKLVEQVKRSPGVSSVEFRGKRDALKAFSEMVGKDSPILLGLDDKNPLPESIEVSFSDEAVRHEDFKRLINDFRDSPHVDSLRVNEGSFSQLGSLLKTIRTAAWFGTLLMLGIAGIIISNAIRLGIYAHRQEIEIMELVGATRWYMRAPFLVEGALEGFLGAVAGVIFLFLLFTPIQSFFESSPLGELWFGSLHFLGFGSVLFILLCGTATGLLSSFLATQSVES